MYRSLGEPRMKEVGKVKQNASFWPHRSPNFTERWQIWYLASILKQFDPSSLWVAVKSKLETEQRIKSTTSLRVEKCQSFACVLPTPGAVRYAHRWENGATNSPLDPPKNGPRKLVKSSITQPCIARFCWNLVDWCIMDWHSRPASWLKPRTIGGTGHLKWQCSANCHFVIILYHLTCYTASSLPGKFASGSERSNRTLELSLPAANWPESLELSFPRTFATENFCIRNLRSAAGNDSDRDLDV